MSKRTWTQADLATASLIIAWQYVLRLKDHDEAAERIEQALESVARLKDGAK